MLGFVFFSLHKILLLKSNVRQVHAQIINTRLNKSSDVNTPEEPPSSSRDRAAPWPCHVRTTFQGDRVLPSVAAGELRLLWGFLGQRVPVCVRLLLFNPEHVTVAHGSARSPSHLSPCKVV